MWEKTDNSKKCPKAEGAYPRKGEFWKEKVLHKPGIQTSLDGMWFKSTS